MYTRYIRKNESKYQKNPL